MPLAEAVFVCYKTLVDFGFEAQVFFKFFVLVFRVEACVMKLCLVFCHNLNETLAARQGGGDDEALSAQSCPCRGATQPDHLHPTSEPGIFVIGLKNLGFASKGSSR